MRLRIDDYRLNIINLFMMQSNTHSYINNYMFVQGQNQFKGYDLSAFQPIRCFNLILTQINL